MKPAKTFEYLKEVDDLAVAVVVEIFSDRIGCEYLYLHPAVSETVVLVSSDGESFTVDVTEFIKPTATNYIGGISLCLISR